jgi:multiple sugar transport system substrate-binding protein
MNDRERRDFQAGLAAEVDAFMRGENTRRDFIKLFGQATGMIAASGPILGMLTDWAVAQQQAELADPSTPLGKAQAAALEASTK